MKYGSRTDMLRHLKRGLAALRRASEEAWVMHEDTGLPQNAQSEPQNIHHRITTAIDILIDAQARAETMGEHEPSSSQDVA